MEECGVCITDKQAKDEDWISKHHMNDLMECITCCGCPLSKRSNREQIKHEFNILYRQ